MIKNRQFRPLVRSLRPVIGPKVPSIPTQFGMVRDTRFRDPNVPDGPGFMPGGDGTLIPIDGFNRFPFVRKAPLGLERLFGRLKEKIRNNPNLILCL